MSEKSFMVEAIVPREVRQSFATRRSALTFVEMFIFVMVAGIVATVVIPQFTTSNQRSRQNSLREDLNYLRTQIAVFKAQHQDVPPGYPRGDPMAFPRQDMFVAQMTLHTDLHCNASAQVFGPYTYGPYLGQIPANPINGLNTFMMIGNNSAIPEPDGTTGWIYKAQTQEIIPNIKGSDAAGNPYSGY